MLKTTFAAAIVVLVPVQPVFAQSDGSTAMSDLAVMNTNTAVASAMNNIAMQQTVRRPNAGPSGHAAAPQASAGNPVAGQLGVSTLRFTPSLARRRINQAAFVARLRAVDPAGSVELARVFANVDVIGQIGQALAPVGLRADNLADAYAIWWLQSWGVAHGDTSESSAAQIQAVRRQATSAMLALPALRATSDAAKQEYAETMLVQTWLMGDFVKQNKDNPVKLQQMAEAVRQGARASGLDLDAMTLTEQGFVAAGAARPPRAAPFRKRERR